MRSPTRILIIGFGDVGERVVHQLAGRYRVTALVRSAEAARRARSLGVRTVRGDLDRPCSLRQLAGIADVVFHFAPPPVKGGHDIRTRRLLAALIRPLRIGLTRAGMLSQPLRHPPRRLVYISTTGVYGDCRGEWIDETRPPRPLTERARRRVDAERALLAWGRRQDVDVSILRAPGIYAQGRLPVERLRRGTAALVSQDDVYTNHIHADDLAGAAIAAMRYGKAGRVYNTVDDSVMKMGDYFDRVADALHLPRPPRVTRAEAQCRLSPAMMSFMSESRRIGNRRLRRELHFKLRYPTVDNFLLRMQGD